MDLTQKKATMATSMFVFALFVLNKNKMAVDAWMRPKQCACIKKVFHMKQELFTESNNKGQY